MHSKEITQLQTLLDNRNDIFAEFISNKPNLKHETMRVNRKTYMLYDTKGIHSNNIALLPELSAVLDSTLNIMSVTVSEYGDEKHPGVYELEWDVNYPVKRYYIANSGALTVAKTVVDEGSLKFVDWVTETEVNFEETAENNIYMSIDIWDPTQTPTDQQIINYFKFYEHFSGVQQLSTELQSFIDAN